MKPAATPSFLYGTAWKEENTQALVTQALNNGFTGIDTANQRKHYHEAAVGKAIQQAFDQGLERKQLFLQTKFTFLPGQDNRLPYDPRASVAKQVEQSFQSSLEHLYTDYLDSYLLHGPMFREGLSDADIEAWVAMEKLYHSGQARTIGVSNFSARQLEGLNHHAGIRPAFVQNRCFAVSGWDKEVRTVCQRHGITYQGFSLLTANPMVSQHPDFQAIVQRTGLTPAQVIFQAAQKMGILPLTGTSDVKHMQEDLQCQHIYLTDEEVEVIEQLLVSPDLP